MDWIKEIFSTFARQYPTFQIDFWIIVGFIGQAMFTMRFVVQWIESEKKEDERYSSIFLVLQPCRRSYPSHLCHTPTETQYLFWRIYRGMLLFQEFVPDTEETVACLSARIEIVITLRNLNSILIFL